MTRSKRFTGVTSDNPPANEVIHVSKLFGWVIHCKLPDGKVIEFLPYLPSSTGGTIWISHAEGSEASHTVEVATVRNVVRECQPDVELCRESESRFYGTGENDD